MRFTWALVLLSAPLIALSKVTIFTDYTLGILYMAIDTWTGAPSSVDIVAIDSSGNQYDFATGVNTTGSGVLRVFLPASIRPGSYHVLVVDPATGETVATSESFDVCESDLSVASSLSLQSVSFTHTITGSIIPYVSTSYPPDYSKYYWSAQTRYPYSAPTPSSSARRVCPGSATSVSFSSPLTARTNSVVTGPSGQSTVPVTRTIVTSTVPVTQTIAGSVSSSSRAAISTLLTNSTTTQSAGLGSEPQLHLALPTASTTTAQSAGFKNTVGGGAFALVAAVAVSAAVFF